MMKKEKKNQDYYYEKADLEYEYRGSDEFLKVFKEKYNLTLFDNTFFWQVDLVLTLEKCRKKGYCFFLDDDLKSVKYIVQHNKKYYPEEYSREMKSLIYGFSDTYVLNGEQAIFEIFLLELKVIFFDVLKTGCFYMKQNAIS